MNRAALLEFGYPQVTAGHSEPCAMPPELLRCIAHVIGAPVVYADIGQRDEPTNRRPVATICQAVKVTSCPNVSPESLYPFFRSFLRVKINLKTVALPLRNVLFCFLKWTCL